MNDQLKAPLSSELIEQIQNAWESLDGLSNIIAELSGKLTPIRREISQTQAEKSDNAEPWPRIFDTAVGREVQGIQDKAQSVRRQLLELFDEVTV